MIPTGPGPDKETILPRYWIGVDEDYPVFRVDEKERMSSLELTEAEADRAKAADAEWSAVQEILRARYRDKYKGN